ncbi:MAG: FAD-binding protein, partial [Myxococcales bacterium]|nr:FAD-binding protein [Myxococcales bacterium]
MLRRRRSKVFRNWARNQSCRPVEIHTPSHPSEISTILQRARALGKRVRCVGAGHSWSPLVCTDDYLVDIAAFNGLQRVDRDKMVVRAGAGITLAELNQKLSERG